MQNEGLEYEKELVYLTCERNWVFYTLMTVAGFFGAYTYLLRGNVFCNAQTGNVVLMGLALGAGHWSKALLLFNPDFGVSSRRVCVGAFAEFGKAQFSYPLGYTPYSD